MDLGLWEKVRRYRRIATLANDEELTRQTKRGARLGEEKITSDKRDAGPHKTLAAD